MNEKIKLTIFYVFFGTVFLIVLGAIAIGIIAFSSYEEQKDHERAGWVCTGYAYLYQDYYLDTGVHSERLKITALGETEFNYPWDQMERPDLGRFDNSLSSLCIPAEWVITFYEKPHYEGRSLQLTGPINVPDLSVFTDGTWFGLWDWHWDNEISSYRVNQRPAVDSEAAGESKDGE